MQKIQELVKEGTLSKTLMADKNFVNKAKEIFKSKNVEMDDKKLAQVLSEIETQIKKGGVLDDKELEQVSGGVNREEIGRGVIMVTTTALGMVAGGVAGVGAMQAGTYLTGDSLTNDGATVGFYVGGLPGGYFGHKLGKLICEKVGLDENN